MKLMKVVSLAIVVFGLAGLARADWDEGDPHKMHFPQLPDLSPTGRDILANYPYPMGPAGKWVADDWRCAGSGLVTDIHIWGSWWNDQVDPQVGFTLAILSDDRSGPYSRPGTLLWQGFFEPGTFSVRPWREDLWPLPEQFLDPNTGLILGPDTRAYQYNFLIEDTPFYQEEGTMYWLAVQALTSMSSYAFGWKTTEGHYEDLAVFGDSPSLGIPPYMWTIITDTQTGTHYDMAFVITPEPQSYALLAGLGLVSFAVVRRFLRK